MLKMFQSTHSRGVRHSYGHHRYRCPCFNPRTHEECDGSSNSFVNILCVSIHALTRSATLPGYGYHGPEGFNPRTHEECDLAILTGRTSLLCFNPRTHEECDLFTRMADLLRRSSIHALTRSATNNGKNTAYDCNVSIHALTRSATHDGTWRMGKRRSFNPRTHEECDKPLGGMPSCAGGFNPRTHEECDLIACSNVPPAQFQSTHSRGVRQ